MQLCGNWSAAICLCLVVFLLIFVQCLIAFSSISGPLMMPIYISRNHSISSPSGSVCIYTVVLGTLWPTPSTALITHKSYLVEGARQFRVTEKILLSTNCAFKFRYRDRGDTILHHVAHDGAASIFLACIPMDRYGGGVCCHNKHIGGCRRN